MNSKNMSFPENALYSCSVFMKGEGSFKTCGAATFIDNNIWLWFGEKVAH